MPASRRDNISKVFIIAGYATLATDDSKQFHHSSSGGMSL
jgi:hypothetical protein